MVFIMIGLFAALSFALNQGMRSGTGQLTDNQAQLAASELMQNASNIRNAVKKLMIDGCTDTQISFETAGIADHANSSTPADGHCKVFAPNGGGLYFTPLQDNFYNSSHASKGVYFSGGNAVIGIGSSSNPTATTDYDLIMFVNGLNGNICQGINKLLGIENIPNNGSDYHPTTAFKGFYAMNGTVAATDLRGKTSGCFYSNTSSMNSYVFYQVLIAR